MIATQGYGTLEQAREDIRNSVKLKLYHPEHSVVIKRAIEDYKQFIEKNFKGE